jgi:hypothetical protein
MIGLRIGLEVRIRVRVGFRVRVSWGHARGLKDILRVSAKLPD